MPTNFISEADKKSVEEDHSGNSPFSLQVEAFLLFASAQFHRCFLVSLRRLFCFKPNFRDTLRLLYEPTKSYNFKIGWLPMEPERTEYVTKGSCFFLIANRFIHFASTSYEWLPVSHESSDLATKKQ